jgi:hypothetical protein
MNSYVRTELKNPFSRRKRVSRKKRVYGENPVLTTNRPAKDIRQFGRFALHQDADPEDSPSCPDGECRERYNSD